VGGKIMTQKAKELIDFLPKKQLIVSDEFGEYYEKFITLSDVEKAITELCDEIEALKKENEWKSPTDMPQIGESVLVKFKHLTNGGEMHEVDIVVNNHEGGRIFSMQGYEDIIVIGYRLI
jgi:hypothetical protein